MAVATAKYVAQGRRDARHTGLRLVRQTGFRCLAARPSTSNAVLIDIHLKRKSDGRHQERQSECRNARMRSLRNPGHGCLSACYNLTNPTYLAPPVRTRNHPPATCSSRARGNIFCWASSYLAERLFPRRRVSSTAKIQKKRLGSDRLALPRALHSSAGR